MTTINHIYDFTFEYRISGCPAADFDCRARVTVKKGSPAGWYEPAIGPELVSIDDLEVECGDAMKRWSNGRRLHVWQPADNHLERMLIEYLEGEGLDALLDEACVLGAREVA